MSAASDHRVVIVTGAAGGIGAASAVRLAQEGASLGLLDRDEQGAAAVARRCEEVGASTIALAVDQADREAVDAGLAQIVDRFGRVDGLFANAGYGQFATFLATSAKNWTRHVDVNLTGTFNVCQAVAQVMADQRSGGAIVLNASSGAETYSDQLFAYCVTKAGVKMLAKGMAAELGVHRIRVNAILPGVIESPMTSPMLDGAEPHRDVLLSETPLGRLGDPGDVAALAAFLLSDDASFITGASINIDGGQTIHGHPRWFRVDYREPFIERWEVPR